MRARYIALVVVAGLVGLGLVPSTGVTQPGPMTPGSGASGSGGPGSSGGYRGGPGGSSRSSSEDPGQLFDRTLSRSANPNGTTISLNDDALRFFREPINEWAKRTGFTGTTLSRDQFIEFGKSPEAEKFRNNLMSRFGGGSRSGGPGGPVSPQAPGTSTPSSSSQPGTVVVIGSSGSGSSTPTVTTQQPMSGSDRGGFGGDRGGYGGDRRGFGDRGRESYEFRQRDHNGDGVLNYDEMSGTLREEREKWDLNHDGVVSQEEYSAYFQAFQARQNENNQGGGFGQNGYGDRGGWGGDRGGWGGDRGGWGGDQGGYGGYGPQQTDNQSATKQEEKKATVYRAGKLPENVPSWFKELDRDQDGQVALYEWKAKDKVVSEFTGMDRNGDGFITFQEAVLATTKPQTGGTAVVSADKKPGESGSGRTSLFGGGGFGGFGNRGSGGGGSDQRGPGGSSPSFGGSKDSGSKDSSSKDSSSKDSSSKDKGPSQGQNSQTDQRINWAFQGKDTLELAKVPGWSGGDRLREWAKTKGITTPTITKEQYKEYLEQQGNSRGPGGGGFQRPGSGGTPGGGGSGNSGGGGGPRR